MSHKAGTEFFQQKRDWSKYKDLVLDYYLKPYLSMVKKIGKPILLVDLYAGPGKFEDGSLGSPLIMLKAAKKIKDIGHEISVLLVEQSPSLADRLKINVETYGDLVTVYNNDCVEIIDTLSEYAKKSTMFIYIDPFSISRIHLGNLSKIFSKIPLGSSVEILIIFMANAFMRWASACISAEAEASHVLNDKMIPAENVDTRLMLIEAYWDADSIKLAKYAIKSKENLDAIAGGDYWRKYASGEEGTYATRLEAFVEHYCSNLKQWFKVACKFPIYGSDDGRMPKYWMLFASSGLSQKSVDRTV